MRWQLLLVICVGCGDNLQATLVPDAPLDSAPLPDTLVCGMTEASCDGTCLDVSADENNCGGCGSVCHGGEVCTTGTCNCPSGVIPPLVFPTGLEQFFGAGGFTLALAPTITLSGLNGLVFGYDAGIPLDTDIDLSTVALGSTPFVGSAVGLDIQNLSIDASYLATAGTIRFTKLCDTEIEGTLTDATFNGISGGLLGGGIPMVDPDGCVMHVNMLVFHLSTAACPSP